MGSLAERLPGPPTPAPRPQQTCPFRCPSGRTSRALATDRTRLNPASRRRLTWSVPVPSEHLGGSPARRLVSRPTPPRPASEPAAQPFFTPSPARPAQSCGGSRPGAGVAAALPAGRKPIRPRGSRDAAATGQTRTARWPRCSGGGTPPAWLRRSVPLLGHAF